MKPLRGAGVTGNGTALVVGRGTMVNAAVYALMSLGFPASRVLVHNSSGLDGTGAPTPRRWSRPPSARPVSAMAAGAKDGPETEPASPLNLSIMSGNFDLAYLHGVELLFSFFLFPSSGPFRDL